MRKIIAIGFLLLFAGGVAFGSGMIVGGGGGDGNATSITDNLIVNADINSAAGIVGSKLADNTVSPPKLKASGTPDNTMYPRYVDDNSFVWTTPPGDASLPVSFNIPDATAGDVFYPQRFTASATIDNVSGFASVDNVVGGLYYCAPDNLASCTKVYATDWTITNDNNVFYTTTFDNAIIPAGYILKWSTTSAGTAANVLSVWVEFH